MGGGGSSSSSYRPPVQAATPRVEPVPQSTIEPNWGPAFGPTATPNPYVAGNTPSWMQGWFANPSWGMDPFGSPLTQEQMMYQRPQQFDQNMQPPPAPPAPAPAAQPTSPSEQVQNYYNQRYGETMAGPESAARHRAADSARVTDVFGRDAARAMGFSPPFYPRRELTIGGRDGG